MLANLLPAGRKLLAAAAAVLLGGLPPASAQEPSSLADPGDDVQAWVKILDRRLYSPPPLDALEFFIQPGTLQDGARIGLPYLVRYRWRRDAGDRVDFAGLDREPLARLPDASGEYSAELLRQYLPILRDHASVILGRSFREQYGDFLGQVRRRKVNGIEEILLDMEPRSHPRLRRVQISLSAEGLPWRIEKSYRNGDATVQHPSFEERPEGLVFTKFTESRTYRDPGHKPLGIARRFQWHRVQGVLLLAETEVESRELPPLVVGKTSYQGMRINGEVPPFEPMAENSGASGGGEGR